MSVADFRFEDLALIAVTNAGKASMRPALRTPQKLRLSLPKTLSIAALCADRRTA
jgi:hypothetical protein